MALVNFIENQGAKMSNSSSSWMNTNGQPGGKQNRERNRERQRERADSRSMMLVARACVCSAAGLPNSLLDSPLIDTLFELHFQT